MPGHPCLSLPLPEPHPARAIQDVALEEQTGTGEPQVWLPAQEQAAGASEGPGPRCHRDIDNNTSVRNPLPTTGPTSPRVTSAQHHLPRDTLPGPLPCPQFKNCNPSPTLSFIFLDDTYLHSTWERFHIFHLPPKCQPAKAGTVSASSQDTAWQALT